MILKFLLIVSCLKAFTCISFPGLIVLFEDENCIAGSSIDLSQKAAASYESINSQLEKDVETSHITSQKEDKSSLTVIHELAEYNDISYSYELIKEKGADHHKVFTLKLYLGDESYTGEGTSMKKAKYNAANQALKSTKYSIPPLKIKESEKSLTPTVLLNNIASKLGLSVTYNLASNILSDQKDNKIDLKQRKSYLQKLNEILHMNDTIHVRKDGGDVKGPFTVSVDVDGERFFGKAHTIQNAKHEAAKEALKYLRDNGQTFSCLNDDDQCKSNKEKLKSPISLVYEAAQKRNLGVSFEVVDEIGPGHKKIFTMQCVVGDLKSTGQGKSKKESKRVAAEAMLVNLLRLPEISDKTNGNNVNNSKKKKKGKVIKSTFDKIDRMLDNMVDFGKDIYDKLTGNTEKNDNDLKKKNNKRNQQSPTEELLQLGKVLDFNIQFTDFVEKEKYYSLVDLGTKPAFVCLGEGVNKKNARDLGAKYSIDTLFKLGFLDNVIHKWDGKSGSPNNEKEFNNFYFYEVTDKEEKNI
ncbi:hypothetical protein ABEB36_004445 [Hypothenemus hampei]|uniref:DRBM domain-containing protein n=1 Tax=Hypothenemus hampei TaxID=57062 RepID=A0ABD1F6H0_HYPHA